MIFVNFLLCNINDTLHCEIEIKENKISVFKNVQFNYRPKQIENRNQYIIF